MDTKNYVRKLFEYLDWYQFADEAELLMAIEEYDSQLQQDENFSPSYSNFVEYNEYADKYIISRKIKNKMWYLKTIDENWKVHRRRYFYFEY